MKILLKRTTKKEGLEKILIQGTIRGSLTVISMIGCLRSGLFTKKHIPLAIISRVEGLFYEIQMDLKSKDQKRTK